MKKIILRIIPILMLATIVALILYFSGLFEFSSNSIFVRTCVAILIIGYLLSTIITIGILVLEKGNPSKTLAWIIIIILLPGLGVIFYTFLGAHFQEESKNNQDNIKYQQIIRHYTNKGILPNGLDENKLGKTTVHHSDNPTLARLIHMLDANPKALFTQNNRLKMLVDGPQTFDELLSDLKNAQHHIHMEYFIWTHDQLGIDIKEILLEKVKEGVEVRIIIDGLGSLSLKNSYIRELRDAGMEVAAFRPVKWAFLNSRSNFRNHRKIVVIDGKIGFTGGINIDGKYIEGDPHLGHWRDTHLKIEGDGVKGLQLVFLTDWYFLMEKKLKPAPYFPKINFENKRQLHIVSSGADAEWDGIKNAYLTIIHSAEEYVWLCTPYLVPGETTLNALKCAAASGIDVRLIVPKQGDSKIVQLASQSFVEELLNYGVTVYEYQEGFVHAKVMVADDQFCTVGSANLDIRSFDQNLEINAFIYDKTLIAELKDQFEIDFKKCKILDAKKYADRSNWIHIKEGLCRLLAPLL